MVKQIGEGGYGKVYLVQNSQHGTLYAMKTIRKDKVLEMHNV